MGKPAAVVAIDPQTGAILALASYPTFNPNLLATLNSAKFAKNDKRLLQGPGAAAAEPGDQRHVPAGLDVQDR